jgi:hypothetical protein
MKTKSETMRIFEALNNSNDWEDRFTSFTLRGELKTNVPRTLANKYVKKINTFLYKLAELRKIKIKIMHLIILDKASQENATI